MDLSEIKSDIQSLCSTMELIELRCFIDDVINDRRSVPKKIFVDKPIIPVSNSIK